MKNYTDLTFVIDRSGSMYSIAREMELGFKAFIENEIASGDETKVSVILFDERYEVSFVGKDIKEVDSVEIKPRGGTALRDALGKTINAVGERLAALPEEERPNRVLIVTITDGYENSSREFDPLALKGMIEHQKEVYAWDFSFIGANIDSFAVGGSLGVTRSATCDFNADADGVRGAWTTLESSYASYKTINRNFDRTSTLCLTKEEDDKDSE